jgi:hypothetical protein
MAAACVRDGLTIGNSYGQSRIRSLRRVDRRSQEIYTIEICK